MNFDHQILTFICIDCVILLYLNDFVGYCALFHMFLFQFPRFVEYRRWDSEDFDFQKLYEVTKVVTRNLNKVIDRNLGWHKMGGLPKWEDGTWGKGLVPDSLGETV